MKINRTIKNKRPILLLEVLIACAIVILCTTALLSPQVEMAIAQQRMVRDSELHHWVNYFYASELLEKMYSKRIPWESIIDKQPVSLDSSRLAELAFTGSYKFTTIWHKPLKQEGTKNFYVMKVTFTFTDLWDKIPGTDKPRTLEYNYELFIEHNQKASDVAPPEAEAKDKAGNKVNNKANPPGKEKDK